MKNPLAGARSALDQSRAALEQIRDRIAALKNNVTAVERLPVDPVEIERRIDQAIFRATHHIVPGGDGALETRGERGVLRFPGFLDPDWRFESAGQFYTKIDTFDFMAAVDPDRLKTAILKTMPTDGISFSERAAKMAEFERDLEAAEIAEEKLAREIEVSTGAQIPRRADANPAILLAPDGELN